MSDHQHWIDSDGKLQVVIPTIITFSSERPKVWHELVDVLVRLGFVWREGIGEFYRPSDGMRGRISWNPEGTEAWLNEPVYLETDYSPAAAAQRAGASVRIAWSLS